MLFGNSLMRASASFLLVAILGVVSLEARSSANNIQQLQVQDQPTTRTAARRNIGRVLEKLRAGKQVTVAYLGGSTTAGLGSSDPSRTSYRALVTEWMRQRYSRSTINEINAAVGGTGSLYGSMRARRDVIAHKPDLVFIEFAAYDANEREDVVRRAMEGIVRQLLTVSQPPEVVLLYATNPGRTARVEAHETVASYYRLASVNLQDQLWSQIDAGKMSAASLWKDGIQVSDDGYSVYARLIIEFLVEQEQQPPSPIVRSLPPPFVSDELTYGELIPFAQLKREPGWRTEAVSDRTLPSTLLVNDKTGAQFEGVFEGTVVGLVFRMGPDGGITECLIDGKPAPAPLDRIDTYHANHQLATRIIAGGLGPGEHRLTIRVTGEKNPKSSGSQLRLGYLLVGGQRPERL